VNGLNLTDCVVQSDDIQMRLESPFTWRRQAVLVFRRAEPARRYRVIVNGAEIGTWSGKELEKGIPVTPSLPVVPPPVR